MAIHTPTHKHNPDSSSPELQKQQQPLLDHNNIVRDATATAIHRTRNIQIPDDYNYELDDGVSETYPLTSRTPVPSPNKKVGSNSGNRRSFFLDPICNMGKYVMKKIHHNASLMEFLIWILLFLTNIMLWYVTNGMNGISMQSYASSLHERNKIIIDPNTTHLTFNDISLTSVVTYLQLLTGAMLGLCILFVLSMLIHRHRDIRPQPHDGQTMISYHVSLLLYNYPFIKKSLSWKTSDLLLSGLHGLGSLATNLGFIYGSASLVQILKLIEPFETLILTKLCSPDESKLLSISIISSMTTVTLSAIALVKQRKTKPHIASILFALCSGLALSSRNVLQRRWYSNQQNQKESSKGKEHVPKLQINASIKANDVIEMTQAVAKIEEGSSMSRDSILNHTRIDDHTSINGKHDESDNNQESSLDVSTNNKLKEADTVTKKSSSPRSISTSSGSQLVGRLEQSLIQYTQLSWQSGIMLLLMTIFQQFISGTFIIVMNSFTFRQTLSGADLLHISWKVLLWHPLYNVFSMITLGFCSALTHSLLNAGKRVVAILMAIVWFHEAFTIRTAITLLVIAIGGIWYVTATTNNTKNNKQSQPVGAVSWFLEHKILQPLACIILLGIVYYQPNQIA